MENGGFLAARRPNPIGLGAVAALHAGVLGAIILAPPEYNPIKIFKPTVIYDVPDKLPPENPPPPPSKTSEKQTETVKLERPIVPTETNSSTILDLRPVDPPREPHVIKPVNPEPPAPVFADAQVDERFRAALQPPYPSALARAEIEGKAVVRVLIGVDGRVKAVESVSATEPGFFEATREQALKRWRFRPATRDGVPVESWRTMTVRFQLAA
jgi:protein TonB